MSPINSTCFSLMFGKSFHQLPCTGECLFRTWCSPRSLCHNSLSLSSHFLLFYFSFSFLFCRPVHMFGITILLECIWLINVSMSINLRSILYIGCSSYKMPKLLNYHQKNTNSNCIDDNNEIIFIKFMNIVEQ